MRYTARMRLRERLARTYFEAVYSPLYDSTTARLSRYVEAHARLAHLLRLEPGQRILCAGLGTGNEMLALREREVLSDLVGIDVSLAALRRARQKTEKSPRGAALARMDGELLGFRDAAFDRVLCYHVLDFVSAPERMTGELLRVLKPGGRFVISLPSAEEGAGLGAALIRHNLARGFMAGLIFWGLFVLGIRLSDAPETALSWNRWTHVTVYLIFLFFYLFSREYTHLRGQGRFVLSCFGVLAAALEWLARDFQQRSGVQCALKIDESIHCEGHHATVLFRICQESLTNVARHAHATSVDVSLSRRRLSAVLTVSDNGRGITSGEMEHPRSFGVIGMRERARALSGSVALRGAPGDGTTVEVKLPLEESTVPADERPEGGPPGRTHGA